MAGIGCLTLGLAPFFPEPHIIGKIRWLAVGGAGMKAIDYFDLFFHAAPWIFLAFVASRIIFKKSNIKSKKNVE